MSSKGTVMQGRGYLLAAMAATLVAAAPADAKKKDDAKTLDKVVRWIP